MLDIAFVFAAIMLRSIPIQGTISEAEQMVQVCAAITDGDEVTNDVIAALVTLETSDGTAIGELIEKRSELETHG